MTAKLLEGAELANNIINDLKTQVADFKNSGLITRLAAVHIGSNPGTRVYMGQQKKSCEEVGIEYVPHELPEGSSEAELIDFILKLNNDDETTAIILLMPLPEEINPKRVQRKLRPVKDIESMHPQNIGRLVYGDMSIAPCTAESAFELLKSTNIDLKGKEVVIVGHSDIVGKPLALLLLASQTDAPTPTVCHVATQDLTLHTKRADIIFVAVGKAGLITGDMVKDGVVVIDIGINRVPVLDENGEPVLNDKGKPKRKVVGDVDFESVKEKASLITPVPGGVGILTTAMLLRNTVRSAKLQGKKRGII